MTMNLDVTVRLLDQTQRNGRAIEETLRRINNAAGAAGNGRASAAGMRGMAKAIEALEKAAPTSLATDRITRFAGAIGTLNYHENQMRQTARTLGVLGRAISKYASLAGEMRSAAKATHDLANALNQMPSSGNGFVSGANAQLQQMLNLQQRAINNMRTLNGGGGGGRRGMGGSGGGGGGHGGGFYGGYDLHRIGGIGRAAVEASMTEEDAITRARMNGISERDLNRMKNVARKTSDKNLSTTYAGNISGILEARLGLGGNLDEALELYPKLSKYGTVFAAAGGAGGDQIKAAKESIYAAARSGELRNVIKNGGRMDSLLQGMMAAGIVSEGRITPQLWASNLQYARSAGIGLDDKFVNSGVLAFLMQELTNSGKSSAVAGQAGNALMSSYSAIVQGRLSKKAVNEFKDSGQLTGADVDKKGMLKQGHHLKDMTTFMHNPVEFMQRMLGNWKGRGKISTTNSADFSQKDKDYVIQHLSDAFGNRVANGLMDILALQSNRVDSFMQMVEAAGYGDKDAVDKKLAMLNNTLSQSQVQLKSAYNDLLVTVTGPFVPAMTGFIKTLNSGAHSLKDWLRPMFGNGSDPNAPGSSANKYALIGGGMAAAFWTGLNIVRRFPAAGTLLGQAFVGLVTGSPMAAFLSRGTVQGVVAALGSTTTVLGRVLAAIAAPEVGIALAAAFVGYFAAGYLGKKIANFTDSFRSPEGKASVISGFQKDLAEQNKIIADPNSGFFAKMWARVGRWADADNLHARGAPLVAGHRAFGGQVRGGSTYLVGERGPELFTPNGGGSVSTNNALRGLISGTNTPDDMRSLGSVLAQAIRLQTFSLTSAISALHPGHGHYGDAGSGGGSSGSGGGGSGRGRGGSSGPGGGDGAGTGPGGSEPAPVGPLGKAGLSDNASVAPGARAFGLGGWRSLAGGGRKRFMAGTKAGRLGIGAVNPDGFAGAGGADRFTKGAGKTLFDRKAPQVMARLMKDFSMSKEDAAAVLGNLGHESAGFTAFEEGGHGPGRGWAQWTDPGRKRRFYQYAAGTLDPSQKQKLDIKSDEANYGFLKWELQHTHKKALSALRNAKGLRAKVRAFEQPFEGAGVKAYDRRDRYADRAMGMNPGGLESPGSVGAFGIGGFNMPAPERGVAGPTTTPSGLSKIASGGAKPKGTLDGYDKDIAGDLSNSSTYKRAGESIVPEGFVVHHTGSRGTPEDIVNTLNKRGLGVQYVMGRDGKVFRTLPEGSRAAHILPSEVAGLNLSNSNTFGMEVIAKDDKDVTPAQVIAARKFYADLKKRYPTIKGAYGHGYLNPGHKQATEGKTITDELRKDDNAPDAPEIKPEDVGRAIARNVPQRNRGFLGAAYSGGDGPAPQVPDAVKKHASLVHHAARNFGSAGGKAGGAGGHTMHVGSVKIDVHGKHHHDEKKIAAAVHERFNNALASQLHDGVYG